MSATISTLALAKRLQENGFTREQAEGLAEALFDQPAPLVTVPILEDRLATAIHNLEQRLTIAMQKQTIRLGSTVVVASGVIIAVLSFLNRMH
jgi:hypothetical protein